MEIPVGQIGVQMGLALFEAVGFQSVDVAKVKEIVEVASHTLPVRGLVTGNPTILEINQRAEMSAEDVVAAATIALENEFGPTPTQLDFQATVFLGMKYVK